MMKMRCALILIESVAKNQLKKRGQFRQNTQGIMRPGGPLNEKGARKMEVRTYLAAHTWI